MKKTNKLWGAMLGLAWSCVLWAQPAPSPGATVAPAAPASMAVGKHGERSGTGGAANGMLAGLDVKAERDRIAIERQRVEDTYNTEHAACYQKFAVNDCLEASRAVRRTALADLKRQEISLNDAERKRKGAAQIQRSEEKESAESQEKEVRRRERSKTQAVTRSEGAERKQRELSTPKSPRAPREPAAARKDPVATEAAAAEERERYQRKLDDAATHKAQVLKRNAERTKEKAQPLPPAP